MKARDWSTPAIGIAALVAAGGWYLWHNHHDDTPVADAPPTEAAAPAAETPAETAPQYPVPEAATTEATPSVPLPGLGESDASTHQALLGLLGNGAIDAYLVPQDLIRRFVVMVDNLTEPTLALRARSIRKIDGAFLVQDQGGLAISPANAARYAGLVAVIKSVDAQRAAQLYFHDYPLFQAAYVELGHPHGYFNDRLVQVIDHLLATPSVSGTIGLTQPKVVYEFADPDLEALSAGQKVLLRIGADNAAVIKAKLRELRAAVAGQHPSAN